MSATKVAAPKSSQDVQHANSTSGHLGGKPEQDRKIDSLNRQEKSVPQHQTKGGWSDESEKQSTDVKKTKDEEYGLDAPKAHEFPEAKTTVKHKQPEAPVTQGPTAKKYASFGSIKS